MLALLLTICGGVQVGYVDTCASNRVWRTVILVLVLLLTGSGMVQVGSFDNFASNRIWQTGLFWCLFCQTGLGYLGACSVADRIWKAWLFGTYFSGS